MASRYEKPIKARKKGTDLNPMGDGQERLIDGIDDQSSTRFTDDVASDEDMLFDDDESEISIRLSRFDDDRVADLEALRRELEERTARFKKEQRKP